ncbi:hypothetical protein PR003_g21158 [Phytophthora rubi]|uniref:SPRY domain-containing protein n=1 Tax=Phytophthora rubi TaxID=129364 RepID=A0A6A3JKQ9_9STRA|nr:hypothetical protein PR001_g20044 [Phytophthora rubi]KAE9306790.1 hypothetical protein PR003_g21158 [Phytophthora rubi]
MSLDPRCVAFEGRLHADRRTAEYVGRASHAADAACFRSSHAVAAGARAQKLRVFYFETQILATATDELAANSPPVRTNTTNSSAAIRRQAAQDRDAAATTARDWRRRAELQAMDLEDVQVPSLVGIGAGGVPVNFNFSLNSRTMQQMRSRIDRRRLRRSNERKKFNHKIAVGFLLDDAEQKSAASDKISSSFSLFPRSSGFLEARMSRRAVKQLMQRILPDVTASAESGSSSEEEDGGEQKSSKTYPVTLHTDLGEAVNSLAYVGKTGRVVSHGRVFLQCERYGAGDVVGCGVLLDSNTFFFTLNGKLMGMLAARDVYDLDDFGQVEESDEEEESEDENDESGEEDGEDEAAVEEDRGMGVRLDRINDVEMEDIDGRHEDEKALYASVSLHGAGECVHAVFEPDEFQFDLAEFELRIQKDRQCGLLTERAKRSENVPSSDVEQSDRKDEVAMNELVQDFFLHYGYESAYKAYESALTPAKRPRLSSGAMDMDGDDEAEASTVTPVVSSVEDMEDETKSEDVDFGEVQSSLYPPQKQQMRESLSLRHEVREHIRRFRTAQALVVLEQHAATLMKNWTGSRSRRFRKLMLYCRILCVIDILTLNIDVNSGPALTANGAITPRNGWNPESAIEFARQVLGPSSAIAANGKRKRQQVSNGVHKKRDGTDDVALAMSLLLYDHRESIPETSRARKFLTPEFRESVADQLNSLLLVSKDSATTPPRISALEAFMKDLESLQKECLHQGCRVYPESAATATNCKCKTSSRRRRASVCSSSDDSSSSQSQSEQDDRLDDDDDGE